MRVLSSLLFISLCVLVCVSAHGDHGDHSHDGDVIVATKDSFDTVVENDLISLVEFFAPWCGHCKQLAPNFASAATSLKGKAQLVSVDCTVEKELCNKYGVQGFPTLKIFRKGQSKPSEYQGGRKADDIVKFMRKQTEPAFITIADEANLNTFTGGKDVVVVAFTASASDDASKSFTEAAELLRNDYSFALDHDASHAAKYGASVPSVVLFKVEGGKTVHVVHTGELTVDALKSFVKSEAFPLVGSIGPENFQQYLDRGLPLVWVFVDEKAAETADVIKAAESAAADFKGKLSVVKLDGVRWGEHAKHFGLSGKLPGIVAEDREANKNYIYDESKPVTAEGLKAHFNGFVNGELVAHQKSQAEPANNDGPVTTIVGTNFERIVLDETKDVLLEFYAPWCGHCKSLAPKYEQLGALFADEESVIIAQVDATENDVPFSVQGFPTIVFYPANDKKNPQTYDGERSVDAMAKFVREHAHTLKGKSASGSGADATPTHEEL